MGDRLATIDMGRKVGAVVPLSGEMTGSSSNTMSPGLWPIPRTKWHLDQSSRLATIDMGPRLNCESRGYTVPLSVRSWLPI